MKKAKIIPSTDVFEKGGIPPGQRLLISVKFTTGNRLYKNLPTLGLNGLLPVNDLVHAEFQFTNDGDREIPETKGVDWFIFYPGHSLPIDGVRARQWKMTIPHLDIGEAKNVRPDWLFMPETSGHYVLMINRPRRYCAGWWEGRQYIDSEDWLGYASEHGVIGRKPAICSDSWKTSFYVMGRGEYLTLNIISVTIILTLVQAVHSILDAIFRCL